MSNPDKFKECITWIKHKASNFGNAKIMHLKYTEDIVVFGGTKRTYNPQMQPRKSSRVKEAQKGKSKNWRTAKHYKNEVSFSTNYEARDWSEYSADFKLPPNYIEIPAVVSNSKEKVDHPTQKPIKLLDYLIKTYTNEGETVLDNTMGSGSTGVAAKQLNRSFIGIEMDDKYFEIAKKRINDANPTVTLFSEFRG
jgi:site-specific DNA-methyltransferase (adenine-specific)